MQPRQGENPLQPEVLGGDEAHGMVVLAWFDRTSLSELRRYLSVHFLASVGVCVLTDVFSCLHGLSYLLTSTAWCTKEEIHAL